MSTILQHGADDVLAKVLWTRLLGTDPAWWRTHAVADRAVGDTTNDWPVFAGSEPESPDELLTVYETSPQGQAGIQVTGEAQQRYGLTVRVRGRTKAAARQKAEAIRHDFNESLYDVKVTLDGQEYSVQSVRATAVPVGKNQTSTSVLWVVNVNCLAVLIAYPTGR